jgi:medium-chain acyl-[acyl-carrier-protein] hydrolase
MDIMQIVGTTGGPWIRISSAPGQRRMRLFCLPCAGGGAGMYRGWRRLLPADVELGLVHLPGREARIAEAAPRAMEDLVPPLADALEPYLDAPFGLFGHSMGALVAFEVARELRRRGAPEPAAILASAHRAPHRPYPRPPIHGLPDAEFLRRLARLGGIPAEILAHQEILDLLLPAMRADVTLCETYRFEPGERLSCPIVVYGGESDVDVTPEDLAGWREATTGPVSIHKFPGDHFYLNADPRALLERVARDLAPRAAAPWLRA